MRASSISRSRVVFQKRRSRWSAAPDSSPYEGRPSGTYSSGGRRRYPQDWGFRQPARYGERMEEVESDEDGSQGVSLDGRTLRAGARGFAGDELYFTGYDLGQDRRSSGKGVSAGADYDGYGYSGHEHRDARSSSHQQDMLYHSAMDQLAKARAKGKTNVNLSIEEMDAIERRMNPQPVQPPPQPRAPLASPPATPVKQKGKVGSRSSSSTSLASQKKGRKASISLFGQSSPTAAKSNSKAKMSRRPSTEPATPEYLPHGAPGIFVPGPDGEPVFTPIYYSPPPSNRVPGVPRTRSRSTSKHAHRDTTPPEPNYQPYHPRFYPPPAGMRPPSSGSHASAPEEPDYYAPAAPRTRSASNAHQYPSSHREDYNGPGPAASGVSPGAGARRNVSGPPDILYGSTLRRTPPGSSPLAQRGHSDPQVRAGADGSRKGSGLSQEVRGEVGGSTYSSSDDQGVQVESFPEQYCSGGGRAPAAGVAFSSGEGGAGRRRRTGRR